MITKRPIENICFIGSNETALMRKLKAYCLLTQHEDLREFEYMLRLRHEGITYVGDIGIIVSKGQRVTEDVRDECERMYQKTKRLPILCLERIDTLSFDVKPTRCIVFATCFKTSDDDVHAALKRTPVTFQTIQTLHPHVHVKEVTT